ncbi:MAG: sugar kinase [Actinomycetota bacterium]
MSGPAHVSEPGRAPAPEVVALGETMLSVVAVDAPLDRATAFHVTHGGAESNVCVGLVRRGISAAWVSALGEDPPGDRIAAALEDEGVDLRWLRRDPERQTGLMLRDTRGTVRYYRADSAASALSAADLDGLPIEGARAVVVTGITALIGDGPGRAALELLRRATGLRVVDVNLRPRLWGSDRAVELIAPLVAEADVVLGGQHEWQAVEPGFEGAALAKRIADRGPREVVVKLGPRGACALGEDGAWVEHAPDPGPDLDSVGAGDAFDAGYLAARLEGLPIERALADGARCGAAVAASLGDTEGIPRS